MAKNPLIRSFSKKVSKPLPNKSAGNLEDYVIRKVINTKEGTITKVPVDDNDIANKKYVDDNVGGTPRLDQVTDPNTNKVFSMANKGIAFDFTNPTGAGGGFDGAFNIEANGGFTGDLLHLHQHTGNPGAGTHVLHCEAVDSDVIPIGITSTHATGIDMGTSKIVGLVDPTANQEAATKKYVDDNDADTTDHTALSNIGTNSHAQIDTSITATGLNTTHRSSDGSDHSIVGTNTTAIGTNTTHRGLTNDPHSVTASQVGLGNVTNVATDDTAYNATSWNTNTDAPTKNVVRDKIETMDTAISSNTSASHAESHNIASHSDTTATGAELDTLTGGTDTTLHDHDGISENTTHRGSDGSDHSAVVTNTSKVSFSKTNVKATINHGGTAGTSRPSGFDSVEWIGTVEPTNAANDDTWIDTT